MPRTATTTIQRVLAGLRCELAENGVLYPGLTPRSAAEPHLSHQHLGETLDGRRPAGEREELLDRLAGLLRTSRTDTVVLSYEGLVLAPRRLALPQRLATLFERHGFAMETLVTVKPQSEYLNSMYTWRTQFVKEARPFPRYLRSAIGWPRFDYEALVRPWREASAGCVHVVPVRDATSVRPFVERVLAACAVPPGLLTGTDIGVVENRSPPALAVETARRIRLRGGHFRLGRNARDATRLVERLVHERGWDTAPFQGVDPIGRANIAAGFAERNKVFAAASWGCAWEDRVAAQSTGPVNELAGRVLDPAIEQAVEELAGAALGQFGAPAPGDMVFRMQAAAARFFQFCAGYGLR